MCTVTCLESVTKGETVTRNQAVEALKRALRPHGIRVDLTRVFSTPGKWRELLAIYFESSSEPGSRKCWFAPKPDFADRVADVALLEGFHLLPPKTVPSDVAGGLSVTETGNPQDSPQEESATPDPVFARVFEGSRLPA